MVLNLKFKYVCQTSQLFPAIGREIFPSAAIPKKRSVGIHSSSTKINIFTVFHKVFYHFYNIMAIYRLYTSIKVRICSTKTQRTGMIEVPSKIIYQAPKA